MNRPEHRREEVRAIRASRTRTAELLGSYPQLSDADRREILSFLQTARHLDIGLLSANDNIRPQLRSWTITGRSLESRGAKPSAQSR